MIRAPSTAEARQGLRLLAYVYHWPPTELYVLQLDDWRRWVNAARESQKGYY
jgi:hypothetical protein